MSLEDDIARIAALRGRSVETYTRPVERSPIKRGEFSLIWSMDSNTKADCEALDELPERSRELITTSPRPINARVWQALLERHGGDEDFVFAELRAMYGEPKAVVRKPRRRFS